MTTTIFKPQSVVHSGNSHLVTMPCGKVVMLKRKSKNGWQSSDVDEQCCIQLLNVDHQQIAYDWRLLPLVDRASVVHQAQMQAHDEHFNHKRK